MTAATDTHDNEDYIDTAMAATVATAEKCCLAAYCTMRLYGDYCVGNLYAE